MNLLPLFIIILAIAFLTGSDSLFYLAYVLGGIGLLTFVFSTILGWSYYGEKAAEYLFGPRIVKPYRWLWVVAVLVGSVLSLPMVWTFADIANGLMAVPNLIALLALSGILIAETRTYLWNGNLDADMVFKDTRDKKGVV